MITCPHCDTEEDDDDERFCASCGFELNKSNAPPPAENIEQTSKQETDEPETETAVTRTGDEPDAPATAMLDEVDEASASTKTSPVEGGLSASIGRAVIARSVGIFFEKCRATTDFSPLAVLS